MSANFHQLAPGVSVIERGWLNCNQIVLRAPTWNVLIDSGMDGDDMQRKRCSM